MNPGSSRPDEQFSPRPPAQLMQPGHPGRSYSPVFPASPPMHPAWALKTLIFFSHVRSPTSKLLVPLALCDYTGLPASLAATWGCWLSILHGSGGRNSLVRKLVDLTRQLKIGKSFANSPQNATRRARLMVWTPRFSLGFLAPLLSRPCDRLKSRGWVMEF